MISSLNNSNYFSNAEYREAALLALNNIIDECNTTIDDAFPDLQKLESSQRRLQIISYLAREALSQPKSRENFERLLNLQLINVEDVIRRIESSGHKEIIFEMGSILAKQSKSDSYFENDYNDKINICNFEIASRLNSNKHNIQSIAACFNEIKSPLVKMVIADSILEELAHIESESEDEILCALETAACNALIKAAAMSQSYNLDTLTNEFFSRLSVEQKRRIINAVSKEALYCLNNNSIYRVDVLESLKGGICNELIKILMNSDKLGLDEVIPSLRHVTSQTLRTKILSGVNNEIFELLENNYHYPEGFPLRLKVVACNIMIKSLLGSNDLNIEKFIEDFQSMPLKIRLKIADIFLVEGSKCFSHISYLDTKENLDLASKIALINALIQLNNVPVKEIEFDLSTLSKSMISVINDLMRLNNLPINEFKFNLLFSDKPLRKKIVQQLFKRAFYIFGSDKSDFIQSELKLLLWIAELYSINNAKKDEIILLANNKGTEMVRLEAFNYLSEVNEAILSAASEIQSINVPAKKFEADSISAIERGTKAKIEGELLSLKQSLLGIDSVEKDKDEAGTGPNKVYLESDEFFKEIQNHFSMFFSS